MQRRKEKPRKKIEIYTRRNGWTQVEFIKALSNSRILIRMSDGSVISRHRKRVRFHITKTVPAIKTSKRKEILAKARRKKKKCNSKRSRKRSFVSRRSDLSKFLSTLNKSEISNWKKKNRL